MAFGTDPQSCDTHYPRAKAQVILCPCRNCTFAAVEGDNPLINEFTDHIRIAHGLILSDEMKQKIIVKIEHLRTNESIPYLDPFLYVPYEDLFK